jgi:hypothetical protein
MNIRGALGRWRVPGPDLEAYYRTEFDSNPYTGPAGGEATAQHYLSEEEADVVLVPDAAGHPPVRLVATGQGFEFAVTDGRLVYYETPALRQFGILTCSVTAMSYYRSVAERPDFRNGQRLLAVREPDNPYDPNAVVLMTRRPARGIGYVNQDRAEWIAQALDDGIQLQAAVLQNSTYGPRVVMATADMLTYLCRKPT